MPCRAGLCHPWVHSHQDKHKSQNKGFHSKQLCVDFHWPIPVRRYVTLIYSGVLFNLVTVCIVYRLNIHPICFQYVWSLTCVLPIGYYSLSPVTSRIFVSSVFHRENTAPCGHYQNITPPRSDKSHQKPSSGPLLTVPFDWRKALACLN